MHAHGFVGAYGCNRVDFLCVGVWLVCSFLMCVYEIYHEHLQGFFRVSLTKLSFKILF